MKPSPGPWRWIAGHWDVMALVSAPDDRVLIQSGSSGDMHIYSEDDKALIQAAPEMREMLLKLEWSGREPSIHPDSDDTVTCPMCGARQSERTHPRCPLAALLEKLR